MSQAVRRCPLVAGFFSIFAKVRAPMLLCRGDQSAVVDDEDVAELRRRQPSVRVELVKGAGHSIQGDRPLRLAELIAEFGESDV